MTIPLSKAALAEINPPFDFDPANTKLVANASINTSVEQDLSQDLDLENTSSSDLFESKTPVLQSPGEPFPTSEQLIPFLHEGGLEISIAKTLSPVLAVISKILEKIYFVEVKDLTLTEKNKGESIHLRELAFQLPFPFPFPAQAYYRKNTFLRLNLYSRTLFL